MKTYKDIYEFPIHCDMAGWVRDKKGQFMFQFEFDEPFLRGNIIGILNGTEVPVNKHNFIHEDGIISKEGNDYIMIRGWGNLTGTGGHNLSSEEAANVQDTLADFILERLNSAA